MNCHGAARKPRSDAWLAGALVCTLLLCPIIAQPAGSLRAAAHQELTDLDSRIRGRVPLSIEERDRPVLAALIDKAQVAMTDDEHRSPGKHWLNAGTGGIFSGEHVFLYGSVAAGSVVLLLLVAALLTIWRMRREIGVRGDAGRHPRISESRLREAMEGTETAGDGGIVQDISDATLRAQSLQESEQRFRATFEQAAVGIAHAAPDGRFLRINRKFCDIVGYPQDEMLERTFNDITHPDDLDSDPEYVRRLLAGDAASYTMEKRCLRKDGELVWVDLTVSLIRNNAGQPQWFVSVVQDISERKQAEYAILDYQNRLKSLAHELTRTEERERRIIATELHDHVGQSLAVMRMQLATARKEAVGRKVGSILDEVSGSLREAIQDTRNIMSDLSSATLNELGLSAAIADWLREKIGERYGLGTRFIDDGEAKPLDEYTKTILFRSVRELLMNVIRHAHASRVSVSIRREADTVRIIVEDDGAGLPAAMGHPDKAGKGGFGLFSIDERMHDIGGALAIESLPGQGVRAVLVAPLEDE